MVRDAKEDRGGVNDDDEARQLLLPLECEQSKENAHPSQQVMQLRRQNVYVCLVMLLLVLLFWGPIAIALIVLYCCYRIQDSLATPYKSNQPTRVKSVDCHTSKPWILTGFYSGHVFLWKSDEMETLRLSVADLPVRACRFVDSRDCFVTASDDMRVRVFATLNGKKLHDLEAHYDYIRAIAVHPTQPRFLTSSDDLKVKLWDLEYNCTSVRTFEEHSHYVMDVQFNPRNLEQFATASLDCDIKFWDINDDSSEALFTLTGHEKGVNSLAFSPTQDLLASGADDSTIRLWDYSTKQLLHVLIGHSHNVNMLMFHKTLAALFSTSEDCTIRLWRTTTTMDGEASNDESYARFEAMACLDYKERGRGWALASNSDGTVFAGFDEGCVCMEMVTKPDGSIALSRDYDVSELVESSSGSMVSSVGVRNP